MYIYDRCAAYCICRRTLGPMLPSLVGLNSNVLLPAPKRAYSKKPFLKLLVVSLHNAVTFLYVAMFDASIPPYKAADRCRLQLHCTRSSKRGVRTVEESFEKVDVRQNGF